MSATGIIDHVVRPHVATTEEKYLDGIQGGVGASQSYTPNNWPSGVDRIVTNIIRLFEARNMGEHCASMPIMAKNVVWDAPQFLLSRKGSVRVSSYFFKFVAHQKFIPSLVEVRPVGMNNHVLEVSGTLLVRPKRTILLPATLLLPETMPIRSTIYIGVNGPLDSGVVELVTVKWHNLPALPNFLRAYNGFMFGTVPHLLEPMWSYLPEFVGDNFYKTRRNSTFTQRHPDSNVPALDRAKDLVSDTANGVIDYGVDTVHNLWEGGAYLYANALEALGFSLGRARATAAEAANLAYDISTRAVGTAANVAGTAYGVAAGTASKAYDTAANVAGTAYGTAANVAGRTYEATADVAGRAYGTAADVANRTAETAGAVAQGAYDTATTAANTAYDTGARAAGAAYETGTRAAGAAYDTSARAAGAAYDTGARTVDAGRETARVGAVRAGQAVDTAAVEARRAADDFERGYEKGKQRPVELPSTRSPAGVTSY
jgi:hypothetical protein